MYNTQGNSLLQFIDGYDNTVWYATQNATFDAYSFLYEQHVAMKLNDGRYHHLLDSTFCAEEPPKGVFADCNFVQIADKRVVIFTRDVAPQNAGQHALRTDVAILTQNVNTSIAQIVESYRPDIVVIDASNTRARIVRWEKECLEAGVKYHRTDRDGAFVIR